MTRLRSLIVALVFATAALVVTSAIHHAGEARATARVLKQNGHVR